MSFIKPTGMKAYSDKTAFLLVILYLLLLSFALIVCNYSLGSFKMSFNDVYYFRAPDGSYLGDMECDIKLDLTVSFAVFVCVFLEGIFALSLRMFLSGARMFFCTLRIIPLLLLFGLFILSKLINDQMLVLELNCLTYISIVLGCTSFVVHSIIGKKWILCVRINSG